MFGMSDYGVHKPAVLLAGPDPVYLDLLEYVLEAEGFRTSRAAADQISEAARTMQADLVLVDGGTSGRSDVWRRMRHDPSTRRTPVVLLTGQDGGVAAKDGPGHCIARSSGPGEIVASLRLALLSHDQADGATGPESGTLRYADIEMDLAAHRVRRAGHEFHLTPIEYRLLKHFIEHPDRVFSREELAAAVWRRNAYVGGRTVDVHMGRLRRALSAGTDDDLIRTVWAVGYALSANQDAAAGSRTSMRKHAGPAAGSI